ncbi:hypothetical protein [Gramella sp. AN32]|uniref:Uncharacterized protein n=1 Tax=Christiangramia antarctica TaxID=2058158 RepID=A0ABW5X660_9FLAO|nr:hypothetical protein [Gramella sp. AN32]MCM4154390.1 hypothetical protein [Gramella sp. AN32]
MGKVFQIVILVITLGIFLVPTSVLAHIDLSHKSEKNCCSGNVEHAQDDCCKNHKTPDNEENDCNGTCGNLACHCPSTINLPVNYSTTSEETIAGVISFYNDHWNYTKQQPKPFYFQIWTPPKLS